MDGSHLELNPRDRGPRLDLAGSALRVPLTDGGERLIPIRDIRTLVVAPGGLSASTLRSPTAWIVLGAAAGVLAVLAATHDGANDAVK
jgi:hypothetical protein